MTDYTPTTDEVRGLYAVTMFRENQPYLHQPLYEHRAEFDRWLEQHDREVAERAWDEGYRTCNQAWVETADIVTPDEDRIDPTNPYSNRRH